MKRGKSSQALKIVDSLCDLTKGAFEMSEEEALLALEEKNISLDEAVGLLLTPSLWNLELTCKLKDSFI